MTNPIPATAPAPPLRLPMPMFHTTIAPLNAELHGALRLNRDAGYGYAAGAATVPIAIGEFEAAAHSYPILFTDATPPVPVVLLGVRPGWNLFVNEMGAWMPGAYVPALVRAFPFAIIEDAAAGTRQFGFEADAACISPTTGPPMFEDGKPTKIVSDAAAFCEACQVELNASIDFGAALDRARLLAPQSATIEVKGGGIVNIDGFRTVDALLKLAAAFGLQLRRDEAVALHQRTLEIKPDLAFVRIALLMAHLPILYREVAEIAECRATYRDCLTRLCADFDKGDIPGDLAAAVGSSQPFYLAYQGYNDRELQSLYGALMCRAVAERYPAAPPPPPPGPGEKVRVGIVAGLFRHHTVWKLLIKGWLTQLDREKFQLFGYHTATPQDGDTELARTLCDRFVQGPLPPERWRDEILADAPHVLIYPDVGMDPGAGQLAAHRLAPVQCVAYGHPNTTATRPSTTFSTAQ